MNLSEDLTCIYCKKIYQDPVILHCCGENVCKKDAKQIIASDGICPNVNCQEKLTTFTTNKKLKKLIEEYELNKVPINGEYKEVLIDFRGKIDKLENMNKDPDNLIYNKFSDLERKVQEDKENAILHINKIADDIMDSLKKYKEQFKTNSLSESKIEKCQELISKLRKEENSYETFISSLANRNDEKDRKKEQMKENLKNLDSEIEKYEKELFDYTTIEYEAMKSELKIKEIFGKLNVIIIYNYQK
jgi:hypothetical protein